MLNIIISGASVFLHRLFTVHDNCTLIRINQIKGFPEVQRQGFAENAGTIM